MKKEVVYFFVERLAMPILVYSFDRWRETELLVSSAMNTSFAKRGLIATWGSSIHACNNMLTYNR